ncbi:MAG: YceD family protein [Candidatus Izemoplasma sp.]
MKWTIQELIRLSNTSNTFNGIIDFKDKIDLFDDIYNVSDVNVEGEYEIYDNQEFVFYMNIKCTLTLSCAITLKEVIYEIDVDVEETFSTYQDNNNHLIEGITIDLLPIIWSNIILEKPMRILSEEAYKNFKETTEKFEEDESANNAFAALKQFKN